MKILLVEPFLTGSHKSWATEYVNFSDHEVEILSLPGRSWKWRMHGGAITLARKLNKSLFVPDLILATDMLDLTSFLALTRKKLNNVPVAVYFHENQLTYPWSPDDNDIKKNRDHHYGFINYTSALAADKLFFNSEFHKRSFLEALPRFLKMFPDHHELATVDEISLKSMVLYPGLDLKQFDRHKIISEKQEPLILWNHRWEYDKNPGDFFKAVLALHEKGFNFKVAILGERYERYPPVFDEARKRLGEKIIQFGYAESFEEYARWLWMSDILPVTSNQDFFGISTVQAIYCNCAPILPARLAFPEHVPDELKGDVLYHSFDEFVKKLEQALIHYKQVNFEALQEKVRGYDWRMLAPVYDQSLEDVLSANGSDQRL